MIPSCGSPPPRALGRAADSRLVPPLLDALAEADPWVRHAAAIALEKLGWTPSDKSEQALASGRAAGAILSGLSAAGSWPLRRKGLKGFAPAGFRFLLRGKSSIKLRC